METIVAAAEAGFDSVGIRVTGRRPGEPDPQVVGRRETVLALKRMLAGRGLRLSNVSGYQFFPELRLSHYLPLLETTAELGAPIIVASCYDPDESRYLATLASFAEAARTFGLKLALEFIPYSEAKTIEQARRLIALVDQPNVGILVDSLHLDRSGGTPADVAKIEPELLYLAQLCDAGIPRPKTPADLRTEAITARLYPGEGNLPLMDFLDALPANTEVECELPNAALSHLSPNEKAKRAGDAFRRFISQHRLGRTRTPS
jgi:sugar phosphate isomerase/epimerase